MGKKMHMGKRKDLEIFPPKEGNGKGCGVVEERREIQMERTESPRAANGSGPWRTDWQLERD